MTTTRRDVMAGAIAATGLGIAGEPLFARGGRDDRLIAGTYANEGGKGLYPIATGPPARRWQGSSTPPTASAAGRTAPSICCANRRWPGDRLWPGLDGAGRCVDRRCGPVSCRDRSRSACLAVPIIPAVRSPSTGWTRARARRRAATLPASRDGPNTERQAGPHAHWVGFSPDRAGCIRSIWGRMRSSPIVRSRRAHAGRAGGRMAAPAGAGPRHMVRHPTLPRAYLACELTPKRLSSIRCPMGVSVTQASMRCSPRARRAVLCRAYRDRSGRADALCVQSRREQHHRLRAGCEGRAPAVQHVPTGGNWPRFFLLREERGEMLVANERSGTVKTFRIARTVA